MMGNKEAAGSVVGIDVGFSESRRSSAVCRLSWTSSSIEWRIERFRAMPEEREQTIRQVIGDEPIYCAALDGPLRRGFNVIGHYRTAERLLTKKLQPKIGKPGQSSAPVGKKLNAAANACADTLLSRGTVLPAKHALAIHERAIVEAFPSSFLGVMLAVPHELETKRGNRSDAFFIHLAETGELDCLVHHHLPGRRLKQPFVSVRNHDDRAALVCALTALAVTAEDYTAVGDDDGWIILPPRSFVQEWAWDLLSQNAGAEGSLFKS